MNARGKPLTPFETFKARFEELLNELYPTETRQLGNGAVSVAKFFEVRIDTQWTNFFWTYKNPSTETFDDAVMNLLVALARVSMDPASPRFDEDTTLLRERQLGGTFSLFHEHPGLLEISPTTLSTCLKHGAAAVENLCRCCRTAGTLTKRLFSGGRFWSQALLSTRS